MKYCITLHVEIEADDISSAGDIADDLAEAINKIDFPEMYSGIIIGDVEELLEDE
jgi:hypothetical protein